MRAFASIYAIIFLLIGIGGFIPGIVSEDHLVQIFRVNVWLSSLHVATGIYALFVGFWKRISARVYFRITGVLYAILATLGFIYRDHTIFGFLANNSADTWFHVVVAVAALVLGFGAKD